jgi:NAD(P)H-hydrate epimerase
VNDATALLSTAEMAEVDRLTVLAGTSVSQLMANAGREVAQAIMRRWSARRVAVLCGPGNNGGDGFAAARVLADAGWKVTVALLGSSDDLRGAAREHAKLWGQPIAPLNAAGPGSTGH